MSYNYNSLLGQMMPRKKARNEDAAHAVPIRQGMFSSFQLFFAASVFTLFGAANAFAQTQLIPVSDGGFETGSTFAANGWTVANDGTGPIKWAVGKAASGTTAQGSTTTGSVSVTLAAANANIAVNQLVYGSGIPANTFVSAISGTTLTLSQAASASSTGNVTLGFGQFSGGISVGTTQLTTASVLATTYSVTLAAANPNISVGMLITSPGFIDTNTYVASISGAKLGLSKPTLNAAALVTAQTLTFAATTSAITGNAAYVTNDNGTTNSYGGPSGSRTIYFYRDITNVPAAEQAMTLSFDVKSSPTSAGWQVWAAPITQPVVGTNTQVTTSQNYAPVWAGAVPGTTQIAFNADPQVATTRMTAFIPKSFAGTPFRLIFVWTHSSSDLTPPAAIDNISLTSRASAEITTAQSGLWSQTSTWDGGQVPTPVDTVILDDAGESVIVDSRYTGCQDLFLAGANTQVQFAISGTMDEFNVYNDFTLNAGGSRFNNHDGTNGKFLKVGHDMTIAASARFDSSIGSSSAFTGRLRLNGSTLQTITVDPAGFVGGSAAGKNGFGNVAGVLNQLEVTNTATVSPNIVWNANGVRINSSIILTTGRVNITSPNRIVLGNYGGATLTIPAGYGFTGGTVSRWMSSSDSYSVPPGTEYPGLDNNSGAFWYPFASVAGGNRSLYLLPDAQPATAGEVAVTYTDANAVTNNLSIADGTYTINKRYNGNWAFSTPEGKADANAASVIFAPNATTLTNRVGVYATGAYEAIDGTSRLMNASAALAGTHQDGTATPFVYRTGLPFAALTALPVYVGVNNADVLNVDTAITSKVSGDWNTASTWVGGAVPSSSSCANVIIAAGTTVTVTGAASAASVTINAGGTLVNNGAATTMTVGCTNNNNAFFNYGTHTMTSGTLKVNGFVAHKAGSFFNQTGGEIIIDSNNNGDAATSVAFGGASCKIETANLALTGGKITIVDPLVNIGTPISATSIGNFSLNTAGATGTFTVNGSIAATTLNTVAIDPSSAFNLFEVGQVISGNASIPANTTITAVTSNQITGALTLTLSAPATAAIATGTPLNFSSMKNGGSTIVLEANATNANLAAGTGVSGPGIQAGSTIVGTPVFAGSGANVLTKITLSLPVTGLGTSPIATQQTLAFAGVNPGSLVVNISTTPLPTVGMAVSGPGIKPGTFVAAITGATVTLSEPIQAGAPAPLVMSFYPFNTMASGSFIYASPSHYSAGLNHTLQIGDGVSAQNTAVITNGFNCQFQMLGGLFSLGNLTVNAPDGANRFMNVSNNNQNNGGTFSFFMNVQNAFTVTAGSVFKKTFSNSTVYVGGNIVNNGTINFPTGGTGLYLGNTIDGGKTAIATTLAQTISGSGSWVANQFYLQPGPQTGYALGVFTVNNANPAGVTLQMPNFKVWSTLNLTNGILHTSAAYPLYCGLDDVVTVTGYSNGGFSSFGVIGSNTAYVDGPVVQAFRSDATITSYKGIPVGKNGKYLPIYMSATGGGQFTFEAFDANSGTVNTANATGLSAARWKVSRVGTAGAFTGYQVKVGNMTTPVTASNVVVSASADQGSYDIISGTTSVFDGTAVPVTIGTATSTTQATTATGIPALSTTVTLAAINTDIAVGQTVTGTNIASGTTVSAISGTALTLSAATTNAAAITAPVTLTFAYAAAPTGASFTGNFAYATKGAGCTGTPAPGATIATSASACGGQSVTLSLANATAGTNVTYQWQSSVNNGTSWTDITGATATTYVASPSADTSYRCNVTCSGSTGASTLVKVTTTPSAATVTGSSMCTAGTANLTAAGSQILDWYDAQTGGNLVNVGTSYSPTVSQTTTYYVASGSVSPGTPVNTAAFVGTSTSSALFKGIAFDANNSLKLNTVTVYPRNTVVSPVTVTLFDATGNIVSGTAPVTFTPTAGSGLITQATTASGMPATSTAVTLAAANSGILVGQAVSGTNIAPNTRVAAISGTALTLSSPTTNATDITAAVTLTFAVSQDVTLNYLVPVGKGYRLVATYGLSSTNTLGNSTATITYPTGGTLNVTGNVSDLSTAPVTTANTTNIFHNLTFTEICESVRVPVTATVVNTPAPTGNATQDACSTGTIVDFTVTGATGATFKWYDAAVAGNVIPTSTKVVLNTTYYVSQTVGGCEGARLAVKATGPCLGIVDVTIPELRFYPNPVSDQLTITAKDAMTRVEVYNLLGQQVNVFDTNSDNIQINFNMFAPSTYLIRVYSEDKVQLFKVIKR